MRDGFCLFSSLVDAVEYMYGEKWSMGVGKRLLRGFLFSMLKEREVSREGIAKR